MDNCVGSWLQIDHYKVRPEYLRTYPRCLSKRLSEKVVLSTASTYRKSSYSHLGVLLGAAFAKVGHTWVSFFNCNYLHENLLWEGTKE